MMPLMRAEDVTAEVVLRLSKITKDQGAETDLGMAIYQGRIHADPDMPPCCVVIEGDDKAELATANTNAKIGQRYIVFAYLPCDPDAPNVTARKAIRDLKRAMFLTDGKPSRNWAGRVYSVDYMGKDIGPREDGAALVVAAVEFVVVYAENLAAP